MSMYLKGNVWWFAKQYQGKRIERSLDTSLKSVAQERHAKLLVEIIDGEYFNRETKKKPFKEMVDRFKAEHTDHRSYYCKARDISSFKFLYKFLLKDKVGVEDKLSLDELGELAAKEHVTLKDVENKIGGYEQWRKVQNIKPGTVVKDLGLLRRMYNVGRKQWGWKIDNPISAIELPKVINERVRYLNPTEHLDLFTALEEAEEPWLKPFVIIGIDTGLRLNNLCELKRNEVDFSSRDIRKEAEVMKNGEYLGIPLTVRACETLRELLKVPCLSGHVFHVNGKPIYDRQVQRAFKKLLTRAGIKNFHVHDLRHTFASYLSQGGVDLYRISVLMGHKDLRMTQRYAHLNCENLRTAVATLETTTDLLQQNHEQFKTA